MTDAVRALFRTAGLKATPHRLQIYAILSAAGASLTADQIFMEVRKTETAINLSTVYRILETFLEKQLVIRSTLLDDSRALYELATQDHRHYLVCTGCRRKVQIDACPLHKLEKELAASTGFVIEAHRLELYGLCPHCAAGRERQERLK